MRRCFYARTYCRLASVLFAVAAAAGISWGLNVVPVQRSGRSVSMVFDISYSMETPDAPGGMTRLKAAADYAEKLIEKLDGTKISVVLAKGDGVIALPLTEDMQAVVTLLENLSPQLMTAAGTSLGSGIKAAALLFLRSLLTQTLSGFLQTAMKLTELCLLLCLNVQNTEFP